MNFFDTFLANFLGTLAGALATAFPLLAIWAFIRRRNSGFKRFWLRKIVTLSFRIRFLMLMISRKRKKSEYRSWESSEHTKRFMVNLVKDGGRARALAVTSFYKSIADNARGINLMFLEGFSLPRLIRYANRMSMNEITNPPKPHLGHVPPEERLDWLMSKTLEELGEWTVRLGEEDRKAWLSWLKSSDFKRQAEAADKSDEEP